MSRPLEKKEGPYGEEEAGRSRPPDRLYTPDRGGEAARSRGTSCPTRWSCPAELGVSRATLREAIRSLCAQGVLEVRRGKGTFVSPQVEEIGDFGFRPPGAE